MKNLLHLFNPYKFIRVIPTEAGFRLSYSYQNIHQERFFNHCPTLDELLEAAEDIIPPPPETIEISGALYDRVYDNPQINPHNGVYRSRTGEIEYTIEMLHALQIKWSDRDSHQPRTISGKPSESQQ